MSAETDINNIFTIWKKSRLEWRDSSICGTIKLDKSVIELIRELSNSEYTEIEIRQNKEIVTTYELEPKIEVEVAIQPPRGSLWCLARDEIDLLSISSLNALPENFALLTKSFKSWNQTEEQKETPWVISASKLINALLEGEILDNSDEHFTIQTFDNKIKISKQSDLNISSNLAKSISEATNSLQTLIEDKLHRKEKNRIIRNSFISSLKSCEEGQRLKHLLTHSKEIIENANQNYELFISDFSFQDDLDKINEQKRDFSIKLNSLLIGIQGKLLAIPVSTILATTQFKDPTDQNFVLINTSVMASSFIFLAIISWLIRSQIIAIKAIRKEIRQKKIRFERDLPKLFDEVQGVFGTLDQDCSLNLRMARLLTFLSIVLTIITWHVYLEKTDTIFEITTSFIGKIIAFFT